MKKGFLPICILLLTAGFGGFFLLRQQAPAHSEAIEQEEPFVEIRTQEYEIQEDDTFTSVMDHLGISYEDALTMVETAAETYDLTRIKAGKTFRKVFEDDVPERIEYESNPDTMVVIQLDGTFSTTIEDIPYDVTIERRDVTISSSLFLSGLDAGLSEVLLLKYVDVFAWEVDFATQIQDGDSFTVLYEKRSRNGEDAGVGTVLYGSFTNVGQKTEAFRFEDGDGSIGYYSPDGEAMVREFLKAPLSYSRISSGYTNARFHPVTRTTSPHLAIDYAAPMGTPILAVADGTITFASWSGGYGNFIHLRHNSVHETRYAHLSRFNVRAGQSVGQGDVIGYVGSTGFSTGPHLHYEVLVNGRKENPLEVEFPKGEPIPDEKRNFYNEQKSSILDILESL